METKHNYNGLIALVIALLLFGGVIYYETSINTKRALAEKSRADSIQQSNNSLQAIIDLQKATDSHQSDKNQDTIAHVVYKQKIKSLNEVRQINNAQYMSADAIEKANIGARLLSDTTGFEPAVSDTTTIK